MHDVLAKCYNRQMKLKYMAVASVLAVCLAAGAETVDPAQFGLSPDAEPVLTSGDGAKAVLKPQR